MHIKNTLITIFSVFLFLISFESKSQVFDGGLAGGFNFSQIDGDRLSGYDKLGFNAGAFVRIPLGSVFTGQMEIKYNNKGAARWGDVINPSIYKVALHYVDIPLLIQPWFTDDLFADIGASAGYLLGAKYVDAAGELPDNPKNLYKDWDINFIVGLNYLITEEIGANIRWYYSLMPAYEKNTGIYQGRIAEIIGLEDGYYNNFLSFSVYLKLNDY